MASLDTIAKATGVSKATVSLVLNGKAEKRVSPAIRDRIIKEARAANYHVNEIARSLRTGQTKIIGVIVTDISNEFFGKLTFYIQEEAKRFGYLILTANSNESPQELDRLVHIFMNKQIDGMIVVPTEHSDRMLKQVIGSGIPLVLVDRFVPGVTADYVGVNNYGTSRKAVERLVEQGYRRTAIICYKLDMDALLSRKRGYFDVMEEHGLSDSSLVYDVSYDRQEESIEETVRRIQDNIDGIDSLYFCSRRVFTESIRCMNRLGVMPLRDKKVLCYDEIEVFNSNHIDIDFIRQPVTQIGKKAFDLLMSKIQDNDRQPSSYIFESEYVSLSPSRLNV